MAEFKIAVAHTLKNEGGFNDIKEDKGGVTNFGISLNFYKKNIDKSADKSTIKNLTQEQACAIYEKFFWRFNNINSQKIANKLFDASVNLGNQQAIKFAQRICNVEDDGICGSNTIKAINDKNSQEFIDEYVKMQTNYYLKIIKNDPSQVIFKNGWLKRAEYDGT
jgi:lysozyme family protein